MPAQIFIEKIFAHPIEKVWDAITTEDALHQWFVPGRFRPEVGFEYLFQNESTKVRGTVKEVSRPNRLIYTWIKNDTDIETTVEWILDETDAGTRLTILHHGIERYETEAPDLMEATTAGWHYVVGAIEKFLDHQ